MLGDIRIKLLPIFLLIFILFFWHPAFSETIILKNGNSVEGKIVEQTDKYIKIDYMGTILTYWKDDIEKIDNSEDVKKNNNLKEEIPVIEEPQETPDVKIKITSNKSEDALRFVAQLDSFGKEIKAIISDTEAKFVDNQDKNLSQEQRSAIMAALEKIKAIIAKIKKLNPPNDCRQLQKIFVEKGESQIKLFEENLPNLSTIEELSKYWADYEAGLNKIINDYDSERKKIVGEAPSPRR